MGIVASREAYDVLSSRIYKYPILSVIRELSTNAHDSHIQAGNEEEAFDLHIPTEDEPYFKIRDYGTGLSREVLETIYFDYFASTKKSDAGQTGMFGLGSKTPFSLVDEYNVVSYYNGTKYVYKYVKKDGVPTPEFKYDEKTKERNGLEISFEYRKNFYDFKRYAYHFFSRANFQPNWNLEISDLESFIKSKQWYTNESIETEYRSYPEASAYILGNSYKLEIEDDTTEELRKAHISKINFIVNDKNAVSVSTSREELHYDEKTVAYIKAQIHQRLENFFKTYEERFDELDAKELCYLYNQTTNIKLSERAYNSLKRIGSAVYGSNFRYVSNLSSDYDKKFICLSTKKCSVVEKKTVTNVMAGEMLTDTKKVSSSAFKNRLKEYIGKDTDCIIIYPSPENFDFVVKITKATVVDYSTMKAATKQETQKRGFITNPTLSYNLYGRFNYSRRYNDKDLKDNEVGLICLDDHYDAEGSGWYKYSNICKYVLDLQEIANTLKIPVDINTTYFIRPVTENSYKQLSAKGFEDAEKFFEKELGKFNSIIEEEKEKNYVEKYIRKTFGNKLYVNSFVDMFKNNKEMFDKACSLDSCLALVLNSLTKLDWSKRIALSPPEDEKYNNEELLEKFPLLHYIKGAPIEQTLEYCFLKQKN